MVDQEMWFVFLVNDYLLENLEKMCAILTELYFLNTIFSLKTLVNF